MVSRCMVIVDWLSTKMGKIKSTIINAVIQNDLFKVLLLFIINPLYKFLIAQNITIYNWQICMIQGKM